MTSPVCWCGNQNLSVFGAQYYECPCGTLVRASYPDGVLTSVHDEERDLYGRNYWFEHQRELGLPDLDARAAGDLHDRLIHWLAIVTAYVRPPARILEIGAGHGGFVKLLSDCGFDATGIELSPWVVDYARNRTGAHVVCGPLAAHDFAAGSFDLIVAFDVLEHLPDPLAAVCHWRHLLADAGTLIIQTPRRPEDATAATTAHSSFVRMLIPEHLHLFSESAGRELLCRAGLLGAVLEQPVFATDMIIASGRCQPRRLGTAPAAVGLPPLVQTLLSVHQVAMTERRTLQRELAVLHERFAESEQDRAARLALLQSIQQRSDELEAAWQAAEAELQSVSATLAQADRDRIDRLARIELLEQQYADADRDRIERLARIEALEHQYARADQDRIDRLHLLEQSDAERLRLETLASDILERCEHAERDRAELSLANGRYQVVVSELEAATKQREQRLRDLEAAEDQQALRLARLESEKRALDERFARLRAVAADHQNSRVYKAMVKVGRWRLFDARLTPLVRDAAAPRFPLGRQVIEHHWTISTSVPPSRKGAIAVDLTPLLAGGENGGAKLVCRSTVQALARLAPDRQWLLLTSSHSHHEVADLEGPNVRRHRIDPAPSALTALLTEQPIAALFSPMTASSFDDPRVPVVCLVHDAQVWAYPEFFENGDRDARRQALEHALTIADSIITPSAFTRDVVATQSQVELQDVHVLPHTFACTRLPMPSEADIAEALERYGLERDRYFVYPANFWPHKNHLMLLVALGQVCARRPGLELNLVLTGANRPDPRPIREAAARMGLSGRVRITGFIPEADLAALLAGSLGVVFPSLYEGFGMPVFEAFAAGCPVACANTSSLPEVAGDAALTFDPRKPAEIAAAMERLATDPELRADLRLRGRTRIQSLESADETGARYLSAIDSVLGRPRRRRDAIGSVFGDGWTNGCLVVSHAGGHAELHLQVENPRDVAVTLATPGMTPLTVPPETGVFLRCSLPAEPGTLVIDVDPTFRPADSGRSTDSRLLGVRIWSCEVHRPGIAPVELLGEVVHV